MITATSLLELYSESGPWALKSMGENVHIALFLIVKNLDNLNIYHNQMIKNGNIHTVECYRL